MIWRVIARWTLRIADATRPFKPTIEALMDDSMLRQTGEGGTEALAQLGNSPGFANLPVLLQRVMGRPAIETFQHLACRIWNVGALVILADEALHSFQRAEPHDCDELYFLT
jgi:hypothetical protein